jgi:hypothetical protein
MTMPNTGGIVFAFEEGTDRQSCAFPGICVTGDGRWLCSFRAAPRKSAMAGQHVALTWSDDDGRTWRDPVRPFPPPSVDGKPGSLRTGYITEREDGSFVAVLCWVDGSDPALPFLNEETEGLLDTRIFASRSHDRGETWSTVKPIPTDAFPVPTPITGPLLLLGNGDLACQFELNKHYDDPAPWRHKSVLMFSPDYGRTWPDHSVASDDPDGRVFFWDQRPAVLPDGRILDFFWTYDTQRAEYLNIHARESRDDGQSWSPMRDTGVPGQPAAPVMLRNGDIAMVYVDRTRAPVISMRTSADGGLTWPPSTELAIYQSVDRSQNVDKRDMNDAWSEMSKFSIGLPATATLPNGDVLVVFYAGDDADRTSIRWAQVQASPRHA